MSKATPPTMSWSKSVPLVVAPLATLPGLFYGFQHGALSPEAGSIIFGVAIFGAAFMLSWAAEAAQIEISQSLAIAILALIAVLPEYAVDFVFTWKAAHDPSQAHYAVANMTGANRLLVGLGWPLILLIAILVKKQKTIVLEKSQWVEVFYLAMATIYSFTIPLKGSLNLFDTFILVGLFAMYTRRVAKMETIEPELVGVAKILADMPMTTRRIATIGLFLYPGLVILAVAEPFAMSLVEAATLMGMDPFHAVQWLAPIASEAPEFIIAATWAARGSGNAAIRALVSSKVNQWTLLIGTIPLVYSISGGAIKPFPLDTLQQHELYLTAAQSLFGVAVLVSLRFTGINGLILAVLFFLQLIIAEIRMEIAAVYLLLALFFHIKYRRFLLPAAKAGLGLK